MKNNKQSKKKANTHTLYTLSQSYVYTDLSKHSHSHTHIDSKQLPTSEYSDHHGKSHHQLLHCCGPPSHKTQHRHESFFPRTVSEWNSLSEQVTYCCTEFFSVSTYTAAQPFDQLNCLSECLSVCLFTLSLSLVNSYTPLPPLPVWHRLLP